MRLFRRARDTKTSVIRREAVSAVVEAAPMPLAPPSSPVAAVIVDDTTPTPKSGSYSSSSSMRVAPISSAVAYADSANAAVAEPAAVPATPPSYEHLDESDVFVKPAPPQSEMVASLGPSQAAAASSSSTTNAPPVKALREVTLFVHGWHQVEPGLLSWTFPSLRAALDAVQRMKNAIGWCIVSGTGWTDLDSARANGAILVEQLA